jgi:hypothetical protein
LKERDLNSLLILILLFLTLVLYSIMPPTQRKLGFSQLRVGIFVFLGLAVLGFLILNSTGDLNPFEKKIHLKAQFPPLTDCVKAEK